MKITEMLTWARSLANLSSSKAISPDDEDKSFNASWKDLYARFLESNDDYFTKTLVFTPLTAMLVGTNEYLIPLPEDFYQLRTAEYQDGTTAGTWLPMDKFPLSSRTDTGFGHPGYRFDNNSLWVRGQSVGAVRIKYYPPPEELTHPDPVLSFGETLTPAIQSGIGAEKISYINSFQEMFYVLTNDIWVQSLKLGTSTNLVTAIAPIRPTYYKGYLYYIQAGDIRRGVFNPAIPATVVPAAITALGTIVSFTINNNVIYFATAAGTFTCALDGSGIAALAAFAVDDICILGSGSLAVFVGRVVATNTVISIGSPSIATDVMHLTSDGTYLYTVDTGNFLHKLTVVAAGTTVQVLRDDILHDNVGYVGNESGGYLSVLHYDAGADFIVVMHTHSTKIDSDIRYPLNTVHEIMSYQAAIDFRTKIGGEFDFGPLIARLGHPKNASEGPATGLWARLEAVVKRDEYKPERVSNSRRVAGNW